MVPEPYIICSFFTLNTPYHQVSHDYLMPSLQKLGIKSDVRGIENLGSWQSNTSYKPEFILQMLNHHKMNVVFLDSDAVVTQYPDLFREIPTEYDVACHLLDKNAWYGDTYDPQFELLSGTIFFRYSPSNLELVSSWIEFCKQNPKMWEQQAFQRLVVEKGIRIFNLPIEYCWIVSLPNGQPPLIKPKTPIVIEHYQVSRKFKNL